MYDVFISYASESREWARKVASALEARDISVWWDRHIPPGKTFDEVIEEALDKSRSVVVLWSQNAVESRWVKTEASEGATRGVLVPALIEEIKIPLEFRRIQTAWLVGWDGDPEAPHFDDLVQAISRVLNRSIPEPSDPAPAPEPIDQQPTTTLAETIAEEPSPVPAPPTYSRSESGNPQPAAAVSRNTSSGASIWLKLTMLLSFTALAFALFYYWQTQIQKVPYWKVAGVNQVLVLLGQNKLLPASNSKTISRVAEQELAILQERSQDSAISNTELLNAYQQLFNGYRYLIDDKPLDAIKTELEQLQKWVTEYQNIQLEHKQFTLTKEEQNWRAFVESSRNSPERTEAEKKLAAVEERVNNFASVRKDEYFLTSKSMGSNLTPEGVTDQFDAGDKVYVYAKVYVPVERERLEFKWYAGGEEIGNRVVTVSRSAGFRVYTAKNYEQDQIGINEVHLYNGNNDLIGRQQFTINTTEQTVED